MEHNNFILTQIKQKASSKFSEFLKSAEDLFIFSEIIMELFEDEIQEEGLDVALDMADRSLSAEDIKRMAKTIRENPSKEIIILRHILEYVKSNPNTKVAIYVQDETKLWDLIKVVKSYAFEFTEAELDAILDDIEEELSLSDDFIESELDLEDEEDDDLYDHFDRIDNLDEEDIETF